MATILVVLILFIGIPILIGHVIYFGSSYDEPGARRFRKADRNRAHHRRPPTRHGKERLA